MLSFLISSDLRMSTFPLNCSGRFSRKKLQQGQTQNKEEEKYG